MKTKKKNNNNEERENLEYRYEITAFKGVEQDIGKNYKVLLPIKTKDGSVKTRTIETENGDEIVDEKEEENPETEDAEIKDTELNDEDFDLKESVNLEDNEPVTTAKLLACREEILKSRRYKIGILSSGILEDPESRTKNFHLLFELMEENDPEVYITVRKLATASLLEIFKDLLPSYPILQIKQEGVKFKKETLQLQKFEGELLRNYKYYLQKLEKMAKVFQRKSNDLRKTEENKIQLGNLAINCMSELLISHPYFNFAQNIAKFLIPFLNSKFSSTRETVYKSFQQVFKEDKRGELSLYITKQLNKYIKSRGCCLHHETISVLTALQIKDINLEKDKEEELKEKKLLSQKQRIRALSKRERKKSQKLEKIERELLETKAEENKKAKEKTFNEVTSLVFTIYFRILKLAPNSKLLSSCLEGLAKFAHCINFEFYQDIVNVLDALFDRGKLGLREKLNSIMTVFVILSGHGSFLNIDPYRFYSHLYKILLDFHIGKSHSEIHLFLNVLIQSLINRRKNITQNRLIAFVKRISTAALGMHHNGALGVLNIIRMIMQMDKSTNILLDTESGVANGLYLAELEDPEYCNAKSTSFWEIAVLQRHYHSIVRQFAKNIAWEVPATGEKCIDSEIAKMNPLEICEAFNPNEIAFKPAVTIPKRIVPKFPTNPDFTNAKFRSYVENCKIECSSFDNQTFDFFASIRKKRHLYDDPREVKLKRKRVR